MGSAASAEQFDPKERILKLKKWINVQIAFYAEQFDPKERILKRLYQAGQSTAMIG